jgi:hypothetical protein
MEQTIANLILAWLCLLQPLFAFCFGVLVGRHGLKLALTRALVKVFGHAPATVDGQQ